MSILITGGSSGIGRAIAERLAKPGEDVFISYHSNFCQAEEVAAALRARGSQPHILPLDVSSLESIREMLFEVGTKTDRLRAVVHAAAIAAPGRIVDLEGEELDRAAVANGTSIAHIVREALPMLKEGSHVIFLTSKGSEKALPGYGGLGAPKALAEHLVRHLAVELAHRGIQINSVSPGPIDTPTLRQMFPDDWATRLAKLNKHNPIGRGVELEDVADMVELMLDSRFSMVQGQTLTLDGGSTL